MKPIEPLAPAGNLACGKAASERGASAACFSRPAFRARAAAGDTTADIGRLARCASVITHERT